jgi:predicted nucleic acid-binding protein
MSLRPNHQEQRRSMCDSSAYFALAETRDVNHRDARAIVAGMTRQHWRLFTTNFIVAEAHALFLARRGRDIASRFLTGLEVSQGTTVVRATSADEQVARSIIARYADKDFSLTDAITFAVMDRLGIRYAFTFDHHSLQYGCSTLAPTHF